MIICSAEDEDKSHVISKLQLHRRPLTSVYSDQELAIYLKHHFTTLSTAQSEASRQRIWASEVDPDKLVTLYLHVSFIFWNGSLNSTSCESKTM